MDCMQIKEKLVQYIEGLITEDEKALIDNHLDVCIECRKKLDEMMEIREMLDISNRQNRSADLENKVFDRIICEQNKRLNKTFKPNPWLENWRSIMKSRIIRLSFATAVVFAVIISIGIFYKSEPIATAQDILSDAVKAVSGLNSIHMKCRMRTSQAGNFDSIYLNYDFLPFEMWKRVDQEGTLQWRVEKSGGTFVVMDGRTTVIFMVPNAAIKVEKPSPLGFGSEYGHDTWMGRLLDVQGLLDNELQKVKDNPNRQASLTHDTIDRKDKIILEVDMKTDVAEDDYLKNSLISSSDSVREYQFDADTKLLEEFKVYVIDNRQEVLVFEITEIEYNAQIDDSVFIADLPNDVTWFVEPQPSSDDEKYSMMTPGDVAYTFFNACSKGDWDVCLKFLPVSEISQKIKDHVIGLEIVSIGEPVKSEKYQVWFVPYEIRYKDGELNKHQLEMIYYNNVKRYIIGAGF